MFRQDITCPALLVFTQGSSNKGPPPPAPPNQPEVVKHTPTRSTASSSKTPVETSTPPTSRLARVRVLSVPPGARILDNGAEIGETPQDVVFRPGLGERVLRVELTDHVPREIVISRSTPSPHTVTLQPIRLRNAPLKPRPVIKSSRARVRKKDPRAPKSKRSGKTSSRKKPKGYEIW